MTTKGVAVAVEEAQDPGHDGVAGECYFWWLVMFQARAAQCNPLTHWTTRLRCTADPTTPAFPAGSSSSQTANFLPSHPLSTRLPGFVPSSLCNLVFLVSFFFLFLLRIPLRTLQLFALLVPLSSTPTSISIIIIITTSLYFRRHQSNSKHRLTKAPIAPTLCLAGRTAQRLIPLFSWCQDGRRNPAGPGHISNCHHTFFPRLPILTRRSSGAPRIPTRHAFAFDCSSTTFFVATHALEGQHH